MTEKEADVNDVFNALKRSGPLAPSQLCSELLLGWNRVLAALKALQNKGYAELRPESGLDKNDPDCPWGLCVRRPVRSSP